MFSDTDTEFCIAGHQIGPKYPPYFIAEMSANHLGSIDRAFNIIKEAKAAGANAVKLQTYTANTITMNAHGKGFDITEGPWSGQNLYQLYQKAHTPWEWHKQLFDLGNEIGITIFSSPFDLTAVKFLSSLESCAYKISSFEILDHELINATAATNKPLIMSTGMADISEIDEALEVALQAGCTNIALLHCVSGYPTPADESNLLRIQYLSNRYNIPIGLSDHTLGNTIPVASVVLGANIIEKHFITSRLDGGPDAEFSLEPDEFKDMVINCLTVWNSIRELSLNPQKSELKNIQYRRSLYVTSDIKAGEKYTRQNVRSIRPGYGLKPKYLDQVLGKHATCDIRCGTPLNWDMIENS